MIPGRKVKELLEVFNYFGKLEEDNLSFLYQILFTKLFCEKAKIKIQPIISPIEKEDLVYFLNNTTNIELLLNYFIEKNTLI